MELHYQTEGDGPPLIILHGLFGSLENWQTIRKRLAHKFQVLAVDQRNHGHSPHSPFISYPLMAEDLFEFMRSHSLGQAHVLGHSMGGKTAMQFALNFPERVARLIVVDIAPRAYPPEHRPLLDALLALDLGAFKSRQQLEQALAPAVPDQSVRRFLLKNVFRKDSGAFHWRMNLRALAHQYAQLTEALSSTSSFAHPTLFVCGENSDYVRPEDLPQIHHFFPQATVRRVTGASHWVHADAPAPFLREVETFLER